jgi:outer membrane protein TolC
LDHRPWLNAQREKISAAEARVALAKKDYYPDFNVGANYGMRAGRGDLTGIMFSMNLPIFSDTKQDRALAQREAENAAAVFSLQDRILQVDSDLRQGLSDHESARQQALLFKTGIIPQAAQTVASMLAGYQVSKVDFLNLVRAQITHYNYETQYWKALSLAHQAMARLQATVGTSITITESNHE